MEFNKARNSIVERVKKVISKVSTNTILLLIILGQTIHILTLEKETILTPPYLMEEARVSRNSASKEYLEPFAYWLVGTVSSIVPGNADEAYKWLEKFFSKDIWVNLGPQILAIKNNPNFNGVNMTSYFVVQGIEYEPRTEKFYVYGKLTSAQYRNGKVQPFRSIYATYEVKMEMKNFIPTVTYWYPYEGVPMTEEWKSKHPGMVEKREAELKKTLDDNQVRPHADESKILDESGDINAEPAAPVKSTSEPTGASNPQALPASQVERGIYPPEPENKAAPQDDML